MQYQKIVLPNGLRVILAPMHDVKAVTIRLYLGAGSRYENLSNNGLSHFFEHMFFKGTKKRPSQLLISKKIEATGGFLNASTGEEEICYVTRLPAHDQGLGLDVLLDMATGSLFRAEDIEKEKKVIVEEINMYEDEPRLLVSDIQKELIYGQTPLGRRILGPKKNILKTKQADFISYKKRFFIPKNMVLAIAGDIDDKKILALIKKYSIKFKGSGLVSAAPNKIKQRSPRVALYKKETDQAHLICGFRTFGRHDERRWILQVIDCILGDGMSSRLFTTIRAKHSLAYYVYSTRDLFSDTGQFAVSAGVDLARLDLAIKLILEEIKKVKKDNVSGAELARAKTNLIGSLELGLESSAAISGFLGEQELLEDKILQPEEIAVKINKVRAADIKKLAQDVFIPKNLNLGVISPFDDKKRFEKIINSFH